MLDFSCYRSRFARGCKKMEKKKETCRFLLSGAKSVSQQSKQLCSRCSNFYLQYDSLLSYFLFYRFLCYLHLLNKSIHMRSGSDLSKSLVRFVLNLVNQSADGLNKTRWLLNITRRGLSLICTETLPLFIVDKNKEDADPWCYEWSIQKIRNR